MLRVDLFHGAEVRLGCSRSDALNCNFAAAECCYRGHTRFANLRVPTRARRGQLRRSLLNQVAARIGIGGRAGIVRGRSRDTGAGVPVGAGIPSDPRIDGAFAGGSSHPAADAFGRPSAARRSAAASTVRTASCGTRAAGAARARPGRRRRLFLGAPSRAAPFAEQVGVGGSPASADEEAEAAGDAHQEPTICRARQARPSEATVTGPCHRSRLAGAVFRLIGRGTFVSVPRALGTADQNGRFFTSLCDVHKCHNEAKLHAIDAAHIPATVAYASRRGAAVLP
jgi:hypothetical protein